MYDIKAMYNQVRIPCQFRRDSVRLTRVQAKNVVLNVSEMEAKVREATNDDPW